MCPFSALLFDVSIVEWMAPRAIDVDGTSRIPSKERCATVSQNPSVSLASPDPDGLTFLAYPAVAVATGPALTQDNSNPDGIPKPRHPTRKKDDNFWQNCCGREPCGEATAYRRPTATYCVPRIAHTIVVSSRHANAVAPESAIRSVCVIKIHLARRHIQKLVCGSQ